ncbi:hypothetical protein NLJ89_g2788 [Agrocybe chaxingu]|uniref:Uncharacterized protein n=1 Tax=Agrocybe chaxingu TaxID=84603 RepID=A0A9W8K588_9AGAR|nr:hypothetical protein NLJ89_g2788 [Agrocybe chaxingu]
MTTSLEQQKLQYSKQLAAYTLRQWNAAREHAGTEQRGKQSPTTSASKRTEQESEVSEARDKGTTTTGNRQGRGSRRGLQAIDFASHSSPRKETPK